MKVKTNPLFNTIAVAVVVLFFLTQQSKAIKCHTQKEITVSKTGIDTTACLLGTNHCHTLEYVLLNSSSLDCTKISVTYDQELQNTIQKSNISGLSIVGSEARLTQVTCNENDSIGFLYEESEDIELANISWNSCTLNYEGDWMSLMAGIFFHNCMNIHIVGCKFIRSLGSGVLLHNVGGNVLIDSSDFTENGFNDCTGLVCNKTAAGLRIQFSYCAQNKECDDSKFKSHANYTIDNCFFTSNQDQAKFYHEVTDYYNIPRGRGAGMYLFLGGGSNYNTFTIRNCNFSKNVAYGEGGGMSAEIFGPNSNSNMIYISGSVFYKNHAGTLGGGIHSRILSPHNETDQTTSNNTLLIKNTTFNSNLVKLIFHTNPTTEMAGGGCFFYTNAGVTTLNNITFINDTWVNNTAQHFGSAVLLQLSYYGINANTSVSFHSCNFSENKLLNMFYQEDEEPMGAVYTENITVSFIGTTNFSNNVGSALAVNSTTAYIYGHATFERNSGVYGGAIILIGNSWITLTEYCHINFTHNYALFLGGAIDSHLASNCIFKYYMYNPKDLTPNFWKANISFYYNKVIANVYNNAIFIGKPGLCKPETDPSTKKTIPYFEYYLDVFSFFPNVTYGQVATGVENIHFSNQSAPKATVGEPFIVHPIATDFYGNPTFAYGQVFLNSTIQQISPYQLHGPGFVLMNEDSTFYVTGPNETEQFHQQGLLFVIHGTKQLLLNTTPLQILNGCKPGYKYNTTKEMCVPAVYDVNLYYPPDTSFACIRYGYWFGVINEYDVVSPCPSKFCNYQTTCDSSSNICSRPGFCLLSEDQCYEGRTGTLCSSCMRNYSFTLDASQCVSSCSTDHIILVVFLILMYWLLFVVFLLLILKFTIGLGSGYLFVILYYFSVLQISINENWPSKPLRLFTKFFIAFTQFSPQILGELGTCFGKNWNSLDFELFNYTNSIVVSFVIASIVLAERCCRCPKVLSFANNSPIRLFCFLILLSYTSLTQSSFEILKVVKFDHIDTYYVSIKPDVAYMSRDHLSYAVIALCVEILILFPFSILVLFASCLEMKLNYVKLRIKPIVDELQASFKNKCRWFAGFYLICRQLLYLLTWIPYPVAMSYVVIIFHVIVFVVHVCFMPYKDMWLNRIDTLFLLNLVLLASLNSPTSTFVSAVPGSDMFQKVMMYFLILLPCAYCLVIFGILAAKWCVSHCKTSSTSLSTENSNNSDLIIAYSYNREHDLNAQTSERDPLLHRK